MSGMEAGWHVLHVRPRREKKMADCCAKHGVEHYLPLREETKVYPRRKVTVRKPVFPGYVFAEFAPTDRATLLQSNHIARILVVEDQPSFLHQLEQVRKALQADPTLGACAAFEQGKKVRITGGPFMGLEGVVQTRKGTARVLLNVEMIGQAVALEVDTGLLEPAE